MSGYSAALALRNSFGDRRPPNITRKITACVSCRKLKVKCDVKTKGAPCTRCRNRGLSCVVNKSLQMILEDDASWKESIERRVSSLEREHSGQRLQPASATNIDDHASNSLLSPQEDVGKHRSPTLNLASNLGAFPAASIDSQAIRDSTVTCNVDLVSRQVIQQDAADQYFEYFMQHLNPLIYEILPTTDTLVDVQRRSPILMASICTVASLCCLESDHYRKCYEALVSEATNKLFSPRYTYDDARALLIAAFWIEEIAPNLSGLAVRISSQLDLHRCITKMPHTKRACHDRTRLFYLTCLCDHQCSLKYGRPPSSQEWKTLKCPTTFLHTEFSNHADLALISQIELWSITRSVFECFGADIERPLPLQSFTGFDRLSEAYDKWSQTWHSVLGLNKQNGSMKGRISELYFHCSKLYLHSHVYRGAAETQRATQADQRNQLKCHFESARSILQIMLDHGTRLVDMPSYFGTMLAFSTVALIKTVREEDALLYSEKREVLQLLIRLTEVLRVIRFPPSSLHPYVGIARGLEQASEVLHSVDTSLQSQEIDLGGNLFMEDVWNMDLSDLGCNWIECNDH